MPERFWELDVFRGIAIILMVAFHTIINLKFFGFMGSFSPGSYWNIASGSIGAMFFLLVGVGLSISHSRAKRFSENIPRKYFARGLKIFALGLLITAGTWAYPHEGFIVFGVLHFIGLGIILAIPFLDRPRLLIPAAALSLLAGAALMGTRWGFPWLLWLGVKTPYFYSLDYYPLLPWFGFVLLGLWAGGKLYANAERRFSLEQNKNMVFGALAFFGRHSLKIYFLHQPVLVGIIFLFFGVPA